ncbi:hypothetical protein [Brassicibacter mesophilus]|uniref:hypothetical protein n=1 Tax=Brassicibacter mesophilus TaxID=745119 RepID=UPI003D1E0B6B
MKRTLSIFILTIILLNIFIVPVLAIGGEKHEHIMIRSLLDLDNKIVQITTDSNGAKDNKDHLEAVFGNFKDFRVGDNLKPITFDEKRSDHVGVELEWNQLLPEEYFVSVRSLGNGQYERVFSSGDIDKDRFPYIDKRSLGNNKDDRKLENKVYNHTSNGDFRFLEYPFRTYKENGSLNSVSSGERDKAEEVATRLQHGVSNLVNFIYDDRRPEDKYEFVYLLQRFIQNVDVSGGSFEFNGEQLNFKIGNPNGSNYDQKKDNEANKNKTSYFYDIKNDMIQIFMWRGNKPFNELRYDEYKVTDYAIPKGYHFFNGKEPEIETMYNYDEDSKFFTLHQQILIALTQYKTKLQTVSNTTLIEPDKGIVGDIEKFFAGAINFITNLMTRDWDNLLSLGYVGSSLKSYVYMYLPIMIAIHVIITTNRLGVEKVKQALAFLIKSEKPDNKITYWGTLENSAVSTVIVISSIPLLYGMMFLLKENGSWLLALAPLGKNSLTSDKLDMAIGGLMVTIVHFIIYINAMVHVILAHIRCFLSPFLVDKDVFVNRTPLGLPLLLFWDIAFTPLSLITLGVASNFANSLNVNPFDRIIVTFILILSVTGILTTITGIDIWNVTKAIGTLGKGVALAGATAKGAGGAMERSGQKGLSNRTSSGVATSGNSSSAQENSNSRETRTADRSAMATQISQNSSKLSDKVSDVSERISNDFKEAYESRGGASESIGNKVLAGTRMAGRGALNTAKFASRNLGRATRGLGGGLEAVGGLASLDAGSFARGAKTSLDAGFDTYDSAKGTVLDGADYAKGAIAEGEYNRDLERRHGIDNISSSTVPNRFISYERDMNHLYNKGVTSIANNKGQIEMGYDYFKAPESMQKQLDKIKEYDKSEKKRELLHEMGINQVKYDYKTDKVNGLTLKAKIALPNMNLNQLRFDSMNNRVIEGKSQEMWNKNPKTFYVPNVDRYERQRMEQQANKTEQVSPNEILNKKASFNN